jgi:hypothetical protein
MVSFSFKFVLIIIYFINKTAYTNREVKGKHLLAYFVLSAAIAYPPIPDPKTAIF